MKFILIRFGCLRQIIAGKADFTVMEAEDLITLRNYNTYNILITNELRFLPNGKYKTKINRQEIFRFYRINCY